MIIPYRLSALHDSVSAVIKYVGAGRVINDAAGISAYNSIYPNNPHPKDAVQRMENTTSPIIHISSFFMGYSSFDA